MMEKALLIILLGNIGVGKGTQAHRMSEAYSVPHISSGDIFRKNVQYGTDIGKQVKQYMDAGQLVPDDLTCEIITARLLKSDCNGGYILDGFPRSLPQAEELEQYLGALESKINFAIHINLADDEIVKRLSARRSCPRCGAIYNLIFNPSIEEGLCDAPDCGAELVRRDDDKPETIRKRLDVYYVTTKPILAFYKDRGVLHTVDATGMTPDDVFEKIESIVSKDRAKI